LVEVFVRSHLALVVRWSEPGRYLPKNRIERGLASEADQRKLDRVSDTTKNRPIDLRRSRQFQRVGDFSGAGRFKSAANTGWAWGPLLALFTNRSGRASRASLAIFARRALWSG
jgi:hypothetical protein